MAQEDRTEFVFRIAPPLIFVREVGAIDNSVFRSLNQVDAATAGRGLRELRRLELLSDKGSGARTY